MKSSGINRRHVWLFLALAVATCLTPLFLGDARSWSLVRASLVLASAVCAICLPIGTALGWLLTRSDMPLRRTALATFGLMLFLPHYLHAAAWEAGFGTLGWFTLATGGQVWLEGWMAVVWIHALATLPWVVLMTGAGFRRIAPELEEQALLDMSAVKVFWHVSLPSSRTAVGIAALWVMLLVAGEMTVTDLFAVRTYAEEIYTELAIGVPLGETPVRLLPGVVLTVGLLVATLVGLGRLMPGNRPVTLKRPRVFPLDAWLVPAVLLVATVLLLLVSVPLLNLCYKAGVTVSLTDLGRDRHWSAVKFVRIVVGTPWEYRREFGWSMLIGSSAATMSTLVGIALAWITRRGRMWASTVMVLVALLFAVPGPLVGLVLIRLVNRPELPPLVWLYDQSILTPLLAQTARSLPLATLILWHALRSVPQEMLDAAAIDGAGPLRRLIWFAIPTRLGAIAVAWLTAMAIALGDLAATILVVPPGVETLSIRIFRLLHYGVEDQVAGVCLVMLAIFATTAAGIGYFTRRWWAER